MPCVLGDMLIEGAAFSKANEWIVQDFGKAGGRVLGEGVLVGNDQHERVATERESLQAFQVFCIRGYADITRLVAHGVDDFVAGPFF